MTQELGLVDYQYYLGPPDGSGTTFGVATNIDVERIRGLHDFSVRAGDRPFPAAHGEVPGRHFVEGREIWFDLEARGTPGSGALASLVQDILSQFSVSEETQLELHWKDPGEAEKFLFARPIRRARVREANTEFGIVPISVALRANDARWYNALEQSISLLHSGPTSGNVTNGGDTRTYPLLRLHWVPIQVGNRARIFNDTSGLHFSVFAKIVGDEYVQADMDKLVRGVRSHGIFEQGLVVIKEAWQTTGHLVTTPDSVEFDITGDLDIRARAICSWWSGEDFFVKPSAYQFGVTGSTQTGDRRLNLIWTSGGSPISVSSDPLDKTNFSENSEHFVRVTLDVDDGGGNYVVTFYESTDGGATWTQLGTTKTGAATSIDTSTADPRVGSVVSEVVDCKVMYVEVRDGIDGTVVTGLNFTDFTRWALGASLGDTGTDPQGHTWTISSGPNQSIDEAVSRYGDWDEPRRPFFLQPGETSLRIGTLQDQEWDVFWHDAFI